MVESPHLIARLFGGRRSQLYLVGTPLQSRQDDFQRVGSEPVGIPVQQGSAFHRRMRADEEIGQYLLFAAPAFAVLRIGLGRQEQGWARHLVRFQGQRGLGTVQPCERGKRQRHLGVNDQVDGQLVDAGPRSQSLAIGRSTSWPTAGVNPGAAMQARVDALRLTVEAKSLRPSVG